MSKFLWYAQNFQWVQNAIFPQWKTYFSQFIDRFLNYEEMEYLIYHVMFELWPALCKFQK